MGNWRREAFSIFTIGRLEVDWWLPFKGFASPRYWCLSWHKGMSYSRFTVLGLEFHLNRWSR
jgi:hypothetical protein